MADSCLQPLLFFAALAAISVVDCRKRMIPNRFCLLTAAAGLISFSPAQVFGILAALPLFIAALLQPECMGGGDIKFTAAAGFVLGFWRGFLGLALGLLMAVLYSGTALLLRRLFRRTKSLTGHESLPFGPFLSIGFAVMYCFGGLLL